MSMMEYYEREQERERQRWAVQWPKENPLLHKQIRVPEINLETLQDRTLCNMTQKLVAQVVDKTDEVIIDAIVAEAARAGVTDLFLIDRQFVLEALIKHTPRNVVLKQGNVLTEPKHFACPTCGNFFGYLYSKPKEEICTAYCPDCGQSLEW